MWKTGLALVFLSCISLATVSQDEVKNPGPDKISVKLAFGWRQSAPLVSVAFSHDGKRIVSVDNGEGVFVWDTETRKRLFGLPIDEYGAYDAQFSPDGKRLATADSDGTISLWDANTGKQLTKLNGHEDTAWRLSFSSDGKLLASSSEDGTARIWDVGKRTALRVLKGHRLGVVGVCFGPEDKLLATSSQDKTIKIWDVETGKQVHSLEGHEDYVRGLAFSSDGRVASSSDDGTVRVWDAGKGRPLLKIVAAEYDLGDVAFSPDGNLLACASSDPRVKIYNSRTGKKLFEMPGDISPFTRVAFHPAGNLLACSSLDKSVRVLSIGEESVETRKTTKTDSGVRTWTDSTGKFRIEASFLRLDGNNVVLKRKDNSKEVQVPIARLSQADVAFIRTKTMAAEKPKSPKRNTPRPSKRPPRIGKRTNPKGTGQLVADKDGVLVVAGFNQRRGIGVRGRNGKYPLNRNNQPGGQGERGWFAPWPAQQNVIFQSETTYEGDGAMRMVGTIGMRRDFAGPLTGKIEIEQFILVPPGGHVIGYVWEKDHNSTGPMWSVKDGKFLTLVGDERGGGQWKQTGTAIKKNQWTRVIVEIDTNQRRWKLKIPEQKFVSEELKYRGQPKTLLGLHYLTETKEGVYIDAIQIRETKKE